MMPSMTSDCSHAGAEIAVKIVAAHDAIDPVITASTQSRNGWRHVDHQSEDEVHDQHEDRQAEETMRDDVVDSVGQGDAVDWLLLLVRHETVDEAIAVIGGKLAGRRRSGSLIGRFAHPPHPESPALSNSRTCSIDGRVTFEQHQRHPARKRIDKNLLGQRDLDGGDGGSISVP